MDVEILTGDLDRPYRVVGPVQARVTSLTLLSPARTIGEVDRELRLAARRARANAVIRVQYDRAISMTSWKTLVAWGTGVVAEAPTFQCGACQAILQVTAVVCSTCGADLVAAQAAATRPLGFTMSADGSGWWDGAGWRNADAEVPSQAPRSGNGRCWWDGRIWRPVPL